MHITHSSLISFVGAIASKVIATDARAKTGKLWDDEADAIAYAKLTETFFYLWVS